MLLFNRIVTTLLLLSFIPVLAVGLIAPEQGIEFWRGVLDWIESQLDPSPSTGMIALRILLALLLIGLLAFLIYLELRRPNVSSVRVHQVEGGEAQIVVESVVDRLAYQVDQLPGVLSVTPTVVPGRRGVEVFMDVEMAVDGTLAANIEEVSAIVRRVVEGDLGLRLKGKPKLNLRTVAYPDSLPGAVPQPTIRDELDDEKAGIEPASAEDVASNLAKESKPDQESEVLEQEAIEMAD
jgi:hypothetical protein